MTTVLWFVLSLASAAAFYLASAHQRLSLRMAAHRVAMRRAAWLSGALAIVAAVAALGVWAGVFAALTAWMFATVLLPYADAWRQARRKTHEETSHVG